MLQPSRFLKEIPNHLQEVQADVSTEGLQSKHHDTSKETTPSTDDLKPNLLPSEVVMVQNDLHHSKFDVASAELMEFGEENHGNGFLKRFSVDERSIISHVFNDWAKKQAFQDPKRLLDKIGFVIDERIRAKNYKHKDGLRSLKSCLKDEDAFHYAQYVLRWQKIPADQRAHLMREKQVSYQLVDAFIWLGIRDMTNEFRKKMLKLRPITYLSGYYSSPPDVPILFDYSSFGEHDQYSLWGRNTTITFTRWTGVKQHRVEEKCLSDSLIHLCSPE